MGIISMFWDNIPILFGILCLGVVIVGICWIFICTAQSNLKLEYLTPDEVEAIKQYRMNKNEVCKDDN